MAARLSTVCRAFSLLLCSVALVQSAPFPDLDKILTDFYTTEVQVTDVIEEASAYATEYYNNIDDQGSVRIFFQGDMQSIYYDNSTYEITEVVESNCTSTDEDISDYDYYPIYIGWLNKNPLVVGPSATLWYAKTRQDKIKEAGNEEIRGIYCDKFELPILNKKENLTIQYYFSTDGWTTPYKQRVPVRIRITGESSMFSVNSSFPVQVDIINDFAYFRPTVIDSNDLIPPIGLGCKGKKETDDFPSIPKVFQFSAEVVDLIQAEKHEDFEIQFYRLWYDQRKQLARSDRYTRKQGYRSNLYDFNTGTVYKTVNDGSCRMTILKDEKFEIYDYGNTRRMMEPKEALYLDGTFYEMGEREIRGLICDVFESVKFDEEYNNKKYYKLVTTVYFTKSSTKVGVNGEMESRIPVYVLVNGYSAPDNKTLQMQYNIFEFNDYIFPEMYSTFKLERCYTKPDSKAYFVLVLEVPAKIASVMEDQDVEITTELRNQISIHAKVPDMRIPYLKVDYKPIGVYATGVLLERPPAQLQFYKEYSGPVITYDPFVKLATEANNLEDCSNACIDEGDFLCKGYFVCGKDCFLKSTDITDIEDGEKTELGYCDTYSRAEIDSTNFRQAYLRDALENLEKAVLNQSIAVEFEIMKGEAVVKVKDVVIGDGPYIGEDTGDKPFVVRVESRKLNRGYTTTKYIGYVESLHDCYKSCKRAGSECSSFSFCQDSQECMITSILVVQDEIKDSELISHNSTSCNIYSLKFADYFIAYPEKTSLLPGDQVYTYIESHEECARKCHTETGFKCRGYEFCKTVKTCTLHKKHILDLQPGEYGSSTGRACTHYAAKYIADYMDMGGVLIDDKTDVRTAISLEDCAKICSEDLQENCKSFNFCPDGDFDDEGTCTLTSKLLKDSPPLSEDLENWSCSHYERRDTVHDWDNDKAKSLAATGYTNKGFAGLVIGMLALGLVVGALLFVLYSYMKSRSSNEGMAVRFMKNET